MRILAFLFVLTLLVPLHSEAGTYPLGESFTIQVGETVNVGDPSIVITFDQVLSDSRCPLDVFCFWEGEATVQLLLSAPDALGEFVEVHTAGSPLGPSFVRYRGYEVTLIAVAPEPWMRDPIDPSDYKLELRVDEFNALPVDEASWSMLKAGYK